MVGLSEVQGPPPVAADEARYSLDCPIAAGQGYASVDELRVLATTSPSITGLAVISTPASDDTYGLGEHIRVSATFNMDVEVDGNPGLGLKVGERWRAAYYLSGSGSDTLLFGYRVKSQDSDSDGISMDGGYQDGNGVWHNFINHTAVTSEDTGTTASRAYTGIDNQSGHEVDGSKLPFATSVTIESSPPFDATYRLGDRFDFALNLNTEIVVDGAKHISMRVGASDISGWRGARYRSGSGSNTLIFSYTVKAVVGIQVHRYRPANHRSASGGNDPHYKARMPERRPREKASEQRYRVLQPHRQPGPH